MTDDEIVAALEGWDVGDSNDEEIDGLREIVRQLMVDRRGAHLVVELLDEIVPVVTDDSHFHRPECATVVFPATRECSCKTGAYRSWLRSLKEAYEGDASGLRDDVDTDSGLPL